MASRIVFAAIAWLAIGPMGASQAQDGPVGVENVVVVTLDGLRPEEFFGGADEHLIDAEAGGVRDVAGLRGRYWRESAEERRRALLPFIWGTVAERGQVFGDRSRDAPASVTNGLNFSYPGYNEMFCGFGDPRIDSNDPTSNPNRSVLEFLDGLPDYRGRVAAFCTWDVFRAILRADQNGLPVHAGWTPIADEPLSDRQRATNLLIRRLPHYWPGNAFDAVAMEAAVEHLQRHEPRVLYIGLGETDEWAHERRYDLYLDAAHQADAFLRDFWSLLQESPAYRDSTALLLTTDHGRGVNRADWTDHGRDVSGASAIWIAVMGPETPPLGVRQGVASTQGQVAATIAALLGEDFVASSPRSALPLPDVCPAISGAANPE